ncbi:IPT/TIG domain-containing protein [Limibacterium fermenti]|uniref:IPT/TIG domain-containing protein n=1 Tax=Limibacterium fermenti TaxID=3229863 RepID=UPI000E9612D2|nr:hypothetical protein [Porphyromonadaceae bacterium]
MQTIKTIKILCGVLFMILWTACDEKDFSEDYDINLPVSEIVDFNPKTGAVGSEVTLYGENMDLVTSVYIGNASGTIISQDEEKLVFQVPRTAEAGGITVRNNYKREFSSEESFIPHYLDVTITQWPAEIERGLTIKLLGENVDMIRSVKFENLPLSKSAANETSATYATSGLTLPASGKLTVTTKTGQILTSPDINVVEPKDTYVPEQTILLWDFETDPITADGWGSSSYTAEVVNNGFFGKGYQVKAAAGNGWDGCYIKLTSDNGGKGFDFSAFKKPHITFLVNTNGKSGYMNPAITIGGTESDKHFKGQSGDDHKFTTNGWEWRSYDLEAMGWTDIKGNVDKIDLWFRGGNVSSAEPFDIIIDQVMITDGPLNPTLIWDAEAPAGGDLPIAFNGGANLTGYYQGQKYVTYNYTVGSDPWAWLGNIMSVDVPGLDPEKYNNAMYLNFLVNTGDSEGYAGFQLLQGDNKLANQKLDGSYGDNYKFASTNSKWVWRSMLVNISTWDVWGGSADAFNLSQSFNFSVYARGGNIQSGTNAKLNMDYFIFTSVPLDTTKE